jgi:multidrug efflux system membrane fusion protein
MTLPRRCVLVPLLLSSAALAACGGGTGKQGGGRGGGQPPVAVTVARAALVDAPITVGASGVVDPMQTVSVQAQVSGTLLSVEFREGEYVRQGQVLFRIDPRPLEASAAQARAALARDAAQAEAARRNDVRYQTLVREDYVAREEADQVHATALAAAATVEADRALLRAALLNLGYATVHAPIAGRTGSLLVRAGNVVGPSSGPMVVINQLQPVLVRFPVLSRDLPLLQGAVASHPLRVTAVNSDSGVITEEGRLAFLDNAVDSLTGTVTGKAEFRNLSNRFWPGQLVFLTVRLGVQHGVLAVPSAAVMTGQQGSYVYVVDPARKVARSANVQAGRTVGELTLIDRGLRPGDVVVTDGQSRLKPGSRVAIVTGRGGPGATATAGAPGRPGAEGGDAVSAGGGTGGGGSGGGGGGGGGGAAAVGGTGGAAGAAGAGGARSAGGASGTPASGQAAGAAGGRGGGAAGPGATGGVVNGGATPAGGTRATTGGAPVAGAAGAGASTRPAPPGGATPPSGGTTPPPGAGAP